MTLSRIHDSRLTVYFIWNTDKHVLYLARLNKLYELSDVDPSFLLSPSILSPFLGLKWTSDTEFDWNVHLQDVLQSRMPEPLWKRCPCPFSRCSVGNRTRRGSGATVAGLARCMLPGRLVAQFTFSCNVVWVIFMGMGFICSPLVGVGGRRSRTAVSRSFFLANRKRGILVIKRVSSMALEIDATLKIWFYTVCLALCDQPAASSK